MPKARELERKNPAAASIDLGAQYSQKGGNIVVLYISTITDLLESYPALSEGTTAATCQSPAWVVTPADLQPSS